MLLRYVSYCLIAESVSSSGPDAAAGKDIYLCVACPELLTCFKIARSFQIKHGLGLTGHATTGERRGGPVLLYQSNPFFVSVIRRRQPVSAPNIALTQPRSSMLSKQFGCVLIIGKIEPLPSLSFQPSQVPDTIQSLIRDSID